MHNRCPDAVPRHVPEGSIPLFSFEGTAKDCGHEYASLMLEKYPKDTTYLHMARALWKTPDKNVRSVKWASGLLGGREFKTGRYTFATTEGPNILLPSGLLGPVKITAQEK